MPSGFAADFASQKVCLCDANRDARIVWKETARQRRCWHRSGTGRLDTFKQIAFERIGIRWPAALPRISGVICISHVPFGRVLGHALLRGDIPLFTGILWLICSMAALFCRRRSSEKRRMRNRFCFDRPGC